MCRCHVFTVCVLCHDCHRVLMFAYFFHVFSQCSWCFRLCVLCITVLCGCLCFFLYPRVSTDVVNFFVWLIFLLGLRWSLRYPFFYSFTLSIACVQPPPSPEKLSGRGEERRGCCSLAITVFAVFALYRCLQYFLCLLVSLTFFVLYQWFCF